MELGVHHFGGKSYSFKVDVDTTTVGDLKALISPETGLPVDDQILVYNSKTLTDTQTLKEAGIHGSFYKVILGSKSYNPSVKPGNAPPVKPLGPYYSSVHTRIEYDHENVYSKDDMYRLSSTIYHNLKEMASQLSVDHVEQVAEMQQAVHIEVMKGKKEDYQRTFLDHKWEREEMERRRQNRRAAKRAYELGIDLTNEEAAAKEAKLRQ